MTKAEFIESGIIEHYVLGVATDEEIALVNSMRQKYPEIEAEIDTAEESLISYAEAYAKTVPPGVKQKLFTAINEQTAPVKEAVIVSHPGIELKNTFKILAAAASVLLIISLLINFNLFGKLKEAHTQLALLQNQKDVLAQDMEYKKASFQKTEETLQAVLNTSTQTVILKGVAGSPESKAIVYWNVSTHTTYVLAAKLPPPPEGKQYQLWALENGKPIDAGVFDVNNSTDTSLQQVKNIDAAQSFAVTLENKGGSPAPTLTAMYVMGAI